MIDDPHDEWLEEDIFYHANEDRMYALVGEDFWRVLQSHPAVKGAHLPLYLGMNAARYFERELIRAYGDRLSTLLIDIECSDGVMEDRLRELGLNTVIIGADFAMVPGVAKLPRVPSERKHRDHPTSPFQNRRKR